MRPSILLRTNCTSDGLENYNIQECIGQGGTSVVYAAVCKRGRLRDRKVALKQTSAHSSRAYVAISSTLHQALHHPVIVSMFSAFSTQDAFYEIMELCSRGTLFELLQSRRCHVLLESELRGVLKSLVDALTYLRNELVLHRDIKAANILITEDYRVKLSDFGLAIRLPSVVSTTSTFCGSPNYISPEIINSKPYSFPSDVWSVGCLVLTCLTGLPPFESDSVPKILENACRGSYALPLGVSPQARDLLSSLLQTNSNQRIYLDRIMAHPFFHSDLPTVPLQPGVSTDQHDIVKPKPTQHRSLNISYPHSSSLGSKRVPLQDFEDVRHLLEQGAGSDSGRRTVSNPLPRNGYLVYNWGSTTVRGKADPHSTPSLISDLNSSGSSILDSPTQASIVEFSEKKFGNIKIAATRYGLLSPHMDDAPPNVIDGPHIRRTLSQWTQSQENQKPDSVPDFRTKPLAGELSGPSTHQPVQLKIKRSNAQAALPVGVTRPMPFTTSPLNQQTHKLLNGQLTILPSRSLLIDLREGERRRGNKGDEVLLINAEGSQVEVYSAPHLSSPSCLVEPIAIHHISTLPPFYWKQYSDAGGALEQIKRKTPELVFYSATSKCTLMCNKPQANIEIVYPSYSLGSKHRNTDTDQASTPKMRIRFCRQRQTVEIARFVSPNGSQTEGGEWTKKILGTINGTSQISEAGWLGLLDAEKVALNDLRGFVRMCEAVEQLQSEGIVEEGPNGPSQLSSDSPPLEPRNVNRDYAQTSDSKTAKSSSSSTGRTKFSGLSLAPRPTKLSSLNNIKTASSDGHGLASSDVDSTPRRQPTQTTGVTSHSRWNHDEFSEEALSGAGIQTRFIPSVGWCMRYGSKVSQGGRYRIMFLDGVTLDIDVDEEYAEFKSLSGDVTRHRIGEFNSKRKVSNRMKVFQEFVSMFDDQ